ncbi:flagellar motor protein MotB [Sulfobacillus thermosulfidooxidans]|uniref:flagellar motor protein MotB n=1 Tax=Sulfobacillus thermosulfidooxidans TaxID=28034 RepID=UPI0006B4AED1|nr:flagellar motor protein MotB [Sulfobacillus thermosulfidooxidans]
MNEIWEKETENEDGGNENAGMMRWLITYADLITLLLAFFIVLYAMNRTEQVKFSLVSQALANQFDSKSIIGKSPGPSIINGLSGTHAELASLNRLEDELQQKINQAHLSSSVSVTSNERGVEVSLNASLLFAPGSAKVSPQAASLLLQLGNILKTVPNDIEVAGYTDSTPIRTVKYPSNWQLSAARAANVVYILAHVPGINPSRLSIAAFGHYHPIATNKTPQGRQLNRRVNILILRSTVGQVAIGNGP